MNLSQVDIWDVYLSKVMNKQNHFDSIVIGAGMSGGWAAKEFCEQGLNTLLIERGSCLLYTSPSPRDGLLARMPSSA